MLGARLARRHRARRRSRWRRVTPAGLAAYAAAVSTPGSEPVSPVPERLAVRRPLRAHRRPGRRRPPARWPRDGLTTGPGVGQRPDAAGDRQGRDGRDRLSTSLRRFALPSGATGYLNTPRRPSTRRSPASCRESSDWTRSRRPPRGSRSPRSAGHAAAATAGPQACAARRPRGTQRRQLHDQPDRRPLSPQRPVRRRRRGPRGDRRRLRARAVQRLRRRRLPVLLSHQRQRLHRLRSTAAPAAARAAARRRWTSRT